MDCMGFNKNIIPYLDGTLQGHELNDFLRHLDGCSSCSEELEINFIVREGIRILDTEGSAYDLRTAFSDCIEMSRFVLRISKIIRRLSYIVRTLAFWAVLSTLLVYIRILISG